MELQVRECGCIARGTFNVYIFQPAWASKFMNLPEDTEVRLRGDFSRPGLQLQTDDPKVTWTVRPDAVGVASPDPKVDCGRQVASVLAALPLTPMQAVGNNFVFFSPVQEISEFEAFPFWSWLKYFKALPGSIEGRVGGRLFRNDAQLNVGLVLTDSELVVNINAHRDTVESTACINAAESFSTDWESAVSLVAELLDTTVKTNEK